MQAPSAFEIEREVEALRDLRRRSAGPGALVLDPDLPEPVAEAQWTSTAAAAHPDAIDEDTVLAPGADDPSNMFWVPARLHPEIAPSEFKAFLKEHARVAADGTATGGLARAGSSGGAGSALGRKRSMLHKEYDPSASDSDSSTGDVVPMRRSRASVYQNMPQLTISDLQKLEELADEASQSDDPSKLRSLLRRSMSTSGVSCLASSSLACTLTHPLR
jgi:hypothetical protein